MLDKVKRFHPLYLAFILGAMYSVLAFSNPFKAVYYGDVGLMYIQVQDIISSGYTDFSLNYKGEPFDPEYNFFPYKKPFLGEIGGKHYFVFPPYYLVINAFLYQLFSTNGLYIINLVSFLLTLLLIYKLGLKFNLENTFINLSIILYTFGMTASNYNFVFHELPFSILWITLSCYFAISFMESENKIHLLLFSFFGAISLFFRLESIFIIFAATVGLLFYKRKNPVSLIVFSFLGFIIPFVLLMLLNYKIHNHPFGLRYLLNVADSSIFNFKEKLGIIYDLLFSKSISLFYQSPYIIVCLLFPFLRNKIHQPGKHFLFFIVLSSGFLILITAPNNGGHISPRYLFGIYPLVSILSVICFKHSTEYLKSLNREVFLLRNAKLIFYFLFSILTVLSCISTFNNYRWIQRASFGVEAFTHELKTIAKENPVIFRDYSQPLNAQSLYLKQVTFVIEKLNHIPEMIEKLRLAGHERVIVSEIFASEMNENSRSLAESIYTKGLKLDKKEEKYYFPNSTIYANFKWLEIGKKQSILVLNIFLK